jgi:hypothetical protein
MSRYNNHWTNEKPEQLTKVEKLDENETYEIKNVEKIETSFGKRYVLIDKEDNRYWPNKSIEKFIHEHKDIKKFKLQTSEFKSFLNKKGEEIRFLDVDIYY